MLHHWYSELWANGYLSMNAYYIHCFGSVFGSTSVTFLLCLIKPLFLILNQGVAFHSPFIITFLVGANNSTRPQIRLSIAFLCVEPLMYNGTSILSWIPVKWCHHKISNSYRILLSIFVLFIIVCVKNVDS